MSFREAERELVGSDSSCHICHSFICLLFSFLFILFSLVISHHSFFRYGAGGNASAHSGGVMSARKLEETDVLKHAKVDKSLSKAIMQARTAKKMTQKELATAINEKPQVVGEYESGKAIPNPQIISKLERKLGCKLPRPGKKAAAKKTGAAGGATTGGVGARGPPRAGARGSGPPKRR